MRNIRRIRDRDVKSFLPEVQPGAAQSRPAILSKLATIPKWHLEENPSSQAALDRRVGKLRRPTGGAVILREPGHFLVKSYQLRTAFAQRRRAAGPVRPAVGLTARFHEVNPPQTKWCNNAGKHLGKHRASRYKSKTR